MNYLKLIRFPNLVIIALIQYVMRYCVIQPILGINKMELQLSKLDFFFLVFSTLCMVAAGYVINDYFDTKGDRLNRRQVIVGNTISRRAALSLHSILNVVSIVLGGYVSYRIGHWQFVLIFFMASGLLWFYSTTYKYYFVLGSFIVSLLTALIPFMVVVYEIPVLNKEYARILIASHTNFNYLFYWVGAFSFFCFMGMFIGQFIRDLGAICGDKEINRRSLPLVIGLQPAKWVIVSLTSLLCVAMVVLWYMFLNDSIDPITPWYFGVVIILPLIWLCVKVLRFNPSQSIKSCVRLLRWVLLAGISYSFVVYNIMTTQL